MKGDEIDMTIKTLRLTQHSIDVIIKALDKVKSPKADVEDAAIVSEILKTERHR